MDNGTILVIEDNELNMKLVRGLLKLGNYNILEARDANTGIQNARDNKPDIILMDIQLPGMDGLSATRILKDDPELRDIPVIALTSHAMHGDEQAILHAGCDGYISKPLDTRNFLGTISRFLKGEKGSASKPQGETAFYKNKLLIVDDEPLNVKLLAAKLAPHGFDIEFAYSGGEALKKVAVCHPDVILLDIMMPEMDGYEVTRRLKNDPATRDTPIIMVTALDGTEDRVLGLETGAEEYLTKPVHSAELLARVKSMLRLKQYKEQLLLRSRSEHFFVHHDERVEFIDDEKDLPRILLIEDDEKDAKLIQGYLFEQPCHFTLVRRGKEALDYAANQKIDLVLLDILLPDIDGLEVCKRLKNMDHTRDTQIVVITCLSDLETKIKGIELGADDYLVKPINSRELTARVNILLKKKRYIDRLHRSYEKALNSAVIDGLTSLYNHRYFMRFLELEISRSLRYRYPVALIMLDVDNFKHINDAMGHLVGDAILRELAQIIIRNIRETDLAARYGGEEFAIVLPYVDREGSVIVAERIKRAISEYPFADKIIRIEDGITVSQGIAFCPSEVSTAEALIQKADKRLYAVNREGKNSVRAH